MEQEGTSESANKKFFEAFIYRDGAILLNGEKKINHDLINILKKMGIEAEIIFDSPCG